MAWHGCPPKLASSELSTMPNSVPRIKISVLPTAGPFPGVTPVSWSGDRNEKLASLVPTPPPTVTTAALSLPEPFGVAHVKDESEIHPLARQAVPPRDAFSEFCE